LMTSELDLKETCSTIVVVVAEDRTKFIHRQHALRWRDSERA
jgi:hypothetical protein